MQSTTSNFLNAMSDKIDQDKRSYIMSRIRSKDTKPEIFIRHALFSLGYRYRLYRKDLPGTPDLTLKKYKTAIFVHGCFWHCHQGCSKAKIPSSNIEFWTTKLKKNSERDTVVKEKLMSSGWKVLVIWQCSCKKSMTDVLMRLIIDFLHNDQPYGEIGIDDVKNS